MTTTTTARMIPAVKKIVSVPALPVFLFSAFADWAIVIAGIQAKQMIAIKQDSLFIFI